VLFYFCLAVTVSLSGWARFAARQFGGAQGTRHQARGAERARHDVWLVRRRPVYAGLGGVGLLFVYYHKYPPVSLSRHPLKGCWR
jgi:hypothetical protein